MALLLLFALFLLVPGAAENVGEGVIALVTGVLIDPLVALRHRQLCRPRARERCRVVDGEFVEQRVRVRAREALGQVEILTGAAERILIGEVGRVDDEGVAVPATARVAEPSPEY